MARHACCLCTGAGAAAAGAGMARVRCSWACASPLATGRRLGSSIGLRTAQRTASWHLHTRRPIATVTACEPRPRRSAPPPPCAPIRHVQTSKRSSPPPPLSPCSHATRGGQQAASCGGHEGPCASSNGVLHLCSVQRRRPQDAAVPNMALQRQRVRAAPNVQMAGSTTAGATSPATTTTAGTHQLPRTVVGPPPRLRAPPPPQTPTRSPGTCADRRRLSRVQAPV